MDFSALLEPYITGLTQTQIAQVSTYLDLLLRWNAKTNLTAVRDPQQIVTRHFGESFFLARTLFPIVITSATQSREGSAVDDFRSPDDPITRSPDVLDLGSGAGFPAIPLKIACPGITLTLVEAHHTKAVFLREVLRALELHAEVKNVRAERLPPASASLVTLRAVERFESILPLAARLVKNNEHMDAARPRAAQGETTSESPAGAPSHSPTRESRETIDPDLPGSPVRDAISLHGLALLISTAQIPQTQKILPNWRFHPPVPLPKSQNRVVQLVEPNQ